MSLSAHDRRALDLIGDDLAGSDPHLAAMLSFFSRLADGEAVPGREPIRKVRQGEPGQSFCVALTGHQGRCWRTMTAQYWAAVTWLVVSLALITIALVLSRVGPVAGPGFPS